MLSIQKTNDTTHFTLGRILNERRHFWSTQNEVAWPHGNGTRLIDTEPHWTAYDGGGGGVCAARSGHLFITLWTTLVTSILLDNIVSSTFNFIYLKPEYSVCIIELIPGFPTCFWAYTYFEYHNPNYYACVNYVVKYLV